MWQGAAVLAPPADAGQEQPPVGIWQKPYNGENPAGQIWMLSLFCDYVSITGDQDFARGVLSPLAADLVEFVRLRYPQRDQGRMVIAPCNAGETWQGVRDPSEMVCALRDALPRLITVGRAQGWKKELVEQWEQMLASVPEVPRGKFRYQGADVKPEILPGDQLVPAADMSGCEAYKLPWSGDKSALPVERAADGTVCHLAREAVLARQRSAGLCHALVPRTPLAAPSRRLESGRSIRGLSRTAG